MTIHIHQLPDWPAGRSDPHAIGGELAAVRHRQGRLIGRIEATGFAPCREAVLSKLTQDVVMSAEIEGETLDRDQVRAAIARRLGIDIGALPASAALQPRPH